MRRYLVTGGTSGVGRDVTVALVAAGCRVTVVGRNIDRLTELYGEMPLAVRAKVLDFEQVEPNEITTSVQAWAKERDEPFHGVFHAAGAELVHPLRLTSDEAYYKAMSFTASSFGILRAAAGRTTLVDGGSVVIMSSVAAHRGTPGMGPYGAARAAVEALVRSAARELAARHIRVNCVAAGAFESAMHERLLKRLPEASQATYAASHPLGFGMVSEIREAVLYLLSDQARWTTGTTLVVDGGYLA